MPVASSTSIDVLICFDQVMDASEALFKELLGLLVAQDWPKLPKIQAEPKATKAIEEYVEYVAICMAHEQDYPQWHAEAVNAAALKVHSLLESVDVPSADWAADLQWLKVKIGRIFEAVVDGVGLSVTTEKLSEMRDELDRMRRAWKNALEELAENDRLAIIGTIAARRQGKVTRGSSATEDIADRIVERSTAQPVVRGSSPPARPSKKPSRHELIRNQRNKFSAPRREHAPPATWNDIYSEYIGTHRDDPKASPDTLRLRAYPITLAARKATTAN